MAVRRSATVFVLPQGAEEGHGSPFVEHTVKLDLQKDTANTVLEKVEIRRGFLCMSGRIVDDASPAKQWFSTTEPLIAVAVRPDYIESDEARQRCFPARLVDAGVLPLHAVRALGRATWHIGFSDFARAALEARHLVERTGTENHARVRMSVVMDSFGGLGEVAPMREGPGGSLQMLLPPTAAGHLTPPQVRGIWRPEFDYSALSAEERRDLRRRGRTWFQRRQYLETVSEAVVRVFGFHPFEDAATASAEAAAAAGDCDPEGTFEQLRVDRTSDRFDAVSFTAFFVAPRLLMCTRACSYGDRTASYASSYCFTRKPHAPLGLLRLGEDLFRCKEVRGLTDFIAKKLRTTGFELPSDKVPPGNMVVPWNDLMLLEVEEDQQSDRFLLPDLHSVAKGGDVAAVGYHSRPDDHWIDEVFGPRGHNVPDIGERAVSDVFQGYERKCMSFGEALRDAADGTLAHSCSLLPGSLGGPVLSQFEPQKLADGTAVMTFAGINCGRTFSEIDGKVELIEASSTSEHAAKIAKSLNVYNDCTVVRHLVFTLVFQEYVAPQFAGLPEAKHVAEFLTPYRMFVEPECLKTCHRKMLRDAQDCGEWGGDFMERFDVDSALCCFREGARMFSIATIPDISEEEQKLKDTLQASVSAMVMAKQESGAAMPIVSET
eukprot:TRINITY_DN25094_c0_g1_i1.p1 TRINITY_DN25094_c0_g1~~TRINITY_DN25094_c0_g1_i1.p1  ORF type:complete len:661 (+),score=250.11 TRINITY_DN25094_c0_g1_i1:69-2051(+)